MNVQNRGMSFGTILKFTGLSMVGIVSFLVPVSYGGESGTAVSILTAYVGQWLAPVMDLLVIFIMAVSAFGSLFAFLMNVSGKQLPKSVSEYLSVSPLYMISKFLGLAFTVMCVLDIGFKRLNDAAQSMVDLGGTLVSLAVALSFLLVFLTDGGMMEFVAELTKPVMRPLFKVPSDASLDLLASWLGSSDAAVILTQQKYRKGFYSKREAAHIMCDFSLVSVPFCMTVAEIGRVERYFAQMYILLCALGILLGIIMPRIHPLNRIEESYAAKRETPGEAEQSGSIFMRAVRAGSAAAEKFSGRTVWVSGMNTVCSVLLGIMPIAIGWGVLGMFLIEFTPLFDWLSVPMRGVLELLGIEAAQEAAPAVLVGFIDMYIPSLLIAGVQSVETRFIIVTLSLIQIVYITIVGAAVLQSRVGLKARDLLIIFLERTAISLPVIVFAAKLTIR